MTKHARKRSTVRRMGHPSRRSVLRNAASGLALGTLPGWLATAVAGQLPDRDALVAAYRQAAERGRPLFVVVAPDADGGGGWFRGRVWGAVLNHGGDAPLSALATAHLACASLQALAGLLPDGVPEDAWAVRIDTDRVPATFDVFAALAPNGPRGERWTEGFQEQEDAMLDAQMAWLSEGIESLLLPDATLLARYAMLEVGRAPGEVKSLAARLSRGEVPSAAQVARFPATVALAATRHPAMRAAWAGRLAATGRAEWVEERIPGSWWARSHGCGVDFEDHEEAFGVGCGMGYVPARATRMLHFYGPQSPW